MLTTATLPARAIPSGAPAGAVVAGAPVGAAPVGPAPVATAVPPRVRRFARWAAEPEPASVPALRNRARAVLAGWPVRAEVADVLLLAVSELAGNVVRHAAAGGRMRIGLALDRGWLRLEVADRGVRPPRLPNPAAEVDPDSEGGRGLLIVQLLAVELGGELHVVAGEFGSSVCLLLPVA
ncbi:ATP-binding protein [Streptomyces sp. NPDC051704]|uniref:ATP-binding protein n=1 Tax=Streptomyces sp. NPDC051704 TaxID=3365671 RepID=UPI0037B0EE4A